MIYSTLSANSLLILGIGSLVRASPLEHRDLLGISSPFSIEHGIIVLAGAPDSANLNLAGVNRNGLNIPVKKDAEPEPFDFFGLSFPNLFPSAGTSGSVVSTTSAPTAASTVASSTASAATPTSTDAGKAWTLHNTARAAKGINSLVWDKSLESQALAYAKVLAGLGTLVHSPTTTRPNQGENLGYIASTKPFSNAIKNPMEIATTGWLAEAANYNGEVIPQGNYANYGHYTQVMWNATTNVGIAAASNWLGAWFVVARYSSAGNIGGQKPY